MILVLGGTTEGRRVVEVLDEAGTPYYYSTRGDGQQIDSVHAQRVRGGMDAQQMQAFCLSHDIQLLIDAAHPFAENLHHNVDVVSRELALPVIRYERRYPALPADAIVCNDWSDAIVKLQDCPSLLALTGVETIAKLKPYWQTHDTWFRILDRPASWDIVRREGFPEERVITTDLQTPSSSPLKGEGINSREQPAILLPKQEGWEGLSSPFKGDRGGPGLAIITKESGESGWFEEKVRLATELNVPLYVVRRPVLPAWPAVSGPHGLRRAVEHCLPSFYPLRTGLTTGTCATAAAVAALRSLLGAEVGNNESIELPNGEEVSMPILRCEPGFAVVQKDGGCDPDATHGCLIEVRVSKLDAADAAIRIEGGEGVGRVTLPGLGIPIGEAAINPVPQQMIRTNLRKFFAGALRVEVAVPEGREIARKTFNPRLGIVDGISIIGTSGVVRPFSNEAFVEAIRRQMQIAISLECPVVVLNSGLRSEQAVHHHFPGLHASAYIHYGNLIGDALTAAAELNIQHVALCVMIGKAVKLAAGNLNTHSHQVTMNRELLTAWLAEAGCAEAETIAANINMARELPERLGSDLWERLKRIIIEKCIATCRNVYPYTLDFYLLES